MEKQRPIGVFDSGLGGLTTVRELQKILPNEKIVYFGDTGRVPYGTRSLATVQKYAKQDIRFLLSKDVKMVIVACITASSALSEISCSDKNYCPVLKVDALSPAVTAAYHSTRNKKVALIGTNATIKSRAYERALKKLDSEIELTGIPCPLFVPLVENGFTQHDNPVTKLVAKQYLEPLLKRRADTLILGCTHYAILKPVIQQTIGDSVTLIDSGVEAARAAKELLKQTKLLNDFESGDCQYFVSDSTEDFVQNAESILGVSVREQASQIDIELY